MKKDIALGTSTYLLAALLLGLVAQAALEQVGLSGRLASTAATDLIAVPAALWLGLGVGRISRVSLLIASIALAMAAFASVVYILDAIARPTGGSVTWLSVVNQTGQSVLALDFAAALIVPQVWLSGFSRLAANNSSKPTPLRGAA